MNVHKGTFAEGPFSRIRFSQILSPSSLYLLHPLSALSILSSALSILSLPRPSSLCPLILFSAPSIPVPSIKYSVVGAAIWSEAGTGVGYSHEVWRTLCWSRVQGVGLLLFVVDDPVPVVMVYVFFACVSI